MEAPVEIVLRIINEIRTLAEDVQGLPELSNLLKVRVCAIVACLDRLQ